MSKHTAIRRSTLVSSIAMLLVAVMALSGATYAWFSNNTNTKAEGINLTAAAVSGLFIAQDDANFSAVGSAPTDATAWVGSIDWLEARTGMAPASTAMNAIYPSFFTATSDKQDGSVTAGTITNATKGTEYIAKKIWVKTQDTTAKNLMCKVTIGSPENYENKSYERVAIINATGSPSDLVTSGSNPNGWILAPNADTAKGLTSTTDTTGTDVAAMADDTAITVATNFNNEATQCFYVYVWFEGQDADCTNTNSGAGLSVTLDFYTA